MQSQQMEKLKQMIHSSTLLSDAEKAEWLDMLIVMNDKQASELQAILEGPGPSPAAKPAAPATASPTTPAKATPPPVVATPSQPQKMPLSHISNLPKFPLPTSRRRGTLKQWEANLRQALEEKELAGAKPEERLTDGRKAVTSAGAVKPPVSYPKASGKPVKPEPPGPKELNQPKDASLLTLGSMRTMDGGLIPALKKLVAASNYFEVLFYLEKSPLYQTYLDTGRAALSSPAGTFPEQWEGKSLMSKAEFEAFSDLLKSIQFS